MGQREQPALVVPVVFFCPELENNPIKREQSPACLAMQSDRVEGKANLSIFHLWWWGPWAVERIERIGMLSMRYADEEAMKSQAGGYDVTEKLRCISRWSGVAAYRSSLVNLFKLGNVV